MLTEENHNEDRLDLGMLASHIVSRGVSGPNNRNGKQKMISMSSSGQTVDASFEPTPHLVDFLELCFMDGSNLSKVLNVSKLLNNQLAQIPKH